MCICGFIVTCKDKDASKERAKKLLEKVLHLLLISQREDEKIVRSSVEPGQGCDCDTNGKTCFIYVPRLRCYVAAPVLVMLLAWCLGR